MKIYKVSYYNVDCKGRVVPTRALPTEEYFVSKEKADARAEERKSDIWWIAGVSVEEVEVVE